MDKTTLKSWFSKGKKPLASQFAAWIDSFWHKEEKIPISSVDGLSDELISKAEKGNVQELVASSVKDYIGKSQIGEDIFEAAESAPSLGWRDSLQDVIPSSLRMYLSQASLYLCNDDDSQTYLYTLRSLKSAAENGKNGLKINMREILSTGKFALKFRLENYISSQIMKLVDRVIFKHQYQLPLIYGECFGGIYDPLNYVTEDADSMFLVKKEIDAIKRLYPRLPEEKFLMNEFYLAGIIYGNCEVYYKSSDTRVPAMTGCILSTPYFMHASLDSPGKRAYPYLTESVFGLFPCCALQTAYLTEDGTFVMIFVKPNEFGDLEAFWEEQGLGAQSLDLIIPDAFFDLIIDKKTINRRIEESNNL